MKKINITLCVVLALAIVSTMFLLMKRKEAIAQSDNAKLSYEDTLEKYSYDGLTKQNEELQEFATESVRFSSPWAVLL